MTPGNRQQCSGAKSSRKVFLKDERKGIAPFPYGLGAYVL
ncbi:MAG: hypothetical protein K0Q75_2487 [Anaerospora sp.]|nr:hypothetical protein [Anaerospora sp.]